MHGSLRRYQSALHRDGEIGGTNVFTKHLEIIRIITNLANQPTKGVGALTADELKAKFDDGVNLVRGYINGLIDELSASSAASNIGATVPSGNSTASSNVQAALNALFSGVGTVIGDGDIKANMLDVNAVITEKIKDGNVTNSKLKSVSASGTGGAVSTDKINNGAVTSAKIGTGEVKATNIYDGAVSKRFTAQIGTTWTDTSGGAPYSQTISITGMLASDHPVVDVVLSDVYSTAQTQIDEWGKIYRVVSGENSLTVYADAATTEAIDIQILCVRK